MILAVVVFLQLQRSAIVPESNVEHSFVKIDIANVVLAISQLVMVFAVVISIELKRFLIELKCFLQFSLL